ncbi:MAG: hypothetical protein ACK4GR_06465, partial [bacterium]
MLHSVATVSGKLGVVWVVFAYTFYTFYTNLYQSLDTQWSAGWYKSRYKNFGYLKLIPLDKSFALWYNKNH